MNSQVICEISLVFTNVSSIASPCYQGSRRLQVLLVTSGTTVHCNYSERAGHAGVKDAVGL